VPVFPLKDKSCRLLGAGFAALLLISPGLASGWRGEAIAVVDGDHLTVLYNQRHVQIQLHGVEAAARRQPLGRKAVRFTARLVKGKTVNVRPFDTLGGRVEARVTVGGRCASEALLEAGLARWRRTGRRHDEKLQKLEAKAKKARRGLWADGAAAVCKSPPKPPCPEDLTCRRHRDCVLLRSAQCGCPPCHKREAWSMNRAAAKRWRQHRSARRCPKVRCARCPRRLKPVCKKGRCSL
jgi:endonuclease YncB( thermonuclease family)